MTISAKPNLVGDRWAILQTQSNIYRLSISYV